MMIRLHQSNEVIDINALPLIEHSEGKIKLDIFISKEAVKGLSKGNDIVLEV